LTDESFGERHPNERRGATTATHTGRGSPSTTPGSHLECFTFIALLQSQWSDNVIGLLQGGRPFCRPTGCVTFAQIRSTTCYLLDDGSAMKSVDIWFSSEFHALAHCDCSQLIEVVIRPELSNHLIDCKIRSVLAVIGFVIPGSDTIEVLGCRH
jgi:hypothetical protein